MLSPFWIMLLLSLMLFVLLSTVLAYCLNGKRHTDPTPLLLLNGVILVCALLLMQSCDLAEHGQAPALLALVA